MARGDLPAAAPRGFGEGFAPFFIALASFVGALITWLILRPLPRRPLASNVSGLRSVLAGFGPAALIGLQPGDVITHLNNQAINSTKEFTDKLDQLKKQGMKPGTCGTRICRAAFLLHGPDGARYR